MGENLSKHVRKFAHARGRAGPRATLYELEAEAMKALAHPKRLLILDLLSDGEERSVTDLQRETALSQSNLSQNLAVMRGAGLLMTRREGNLIYYRVTDPLVIRAVALMRAVMARQVEDQQFLIERAAEKHKQKVKRATLGAYAVLALLAVAAVFATAHPLLVGGGLADSAQHVQLMVASGSFSGLLEMCSGVTSETPAGPFAAMSTMVA